MAEGSTDYLTMLFSFPHLTAQSILCLFFLAFMRLAPVVAAAPFLGGKLPGAVKMGLLIALTAVILPFMAQHTTHTLDFNATYAGLLLKELLIGFFISFLAMLPFYIAESAGVLIDFLRGSSALMVTDPSTQAQVSPVGLLYNYILIVLFFEINGPYFFLNGVLDTYLIVPPDGWISSSFFQFHQPFWQSLWSVLTTFTMVSMQLAAPSLVAILMAEMFLGIANRLAPQVQIAFLGMSLKSLLGIALLFAGWFFILQQLSKQSLLWLKEISKILQGLSG